MPEQTERRDQDLREFTIETRPRPSAAIRFLRFALWITPAALLMATYVFWQYTETPGWILFLSPLLLTVSTGFFDGLVCTYVPKSDGVPDTRAITSHCLAFTGVQLFFAPALAVATLVAAAYVVPLLHFF